MNLLQTRLTVWFLVGCLSILGSVGVATAQVPLAERLLAEPVEQLVRDAEKFGDPNRGAIAFYLPTMNCAKCHVADGSKGRLGPNLAEKRALDWNHLVESVLQPSAKINEGFQTAQVLMDDGKVMTGVLLNETDDRLTLGLDEKPELPVSFQKRRIEDWQVTKT